MYQHIYNARQASAPLEPLQVKPLSNAHKEVFNFTRYLGKLRWQYQWIKLIAWIRHLDFTVDFSLQVSGSEVYKL